MSLGVSLGLFLSVVGLAFLHFTLLVAAAIAALAAVGAAVEPRSRPALLNHLPQVSFLPGSVELLVNCALVTATVIVAVVTLAQSRHNRAVRRRR